jgi:CHAT domain-containing protein
MIEAITQQIPGLLNGGDARASYVRATMQQMRGKDDSALSTFLHAVDLLERDRRSLHDEQSRGTFLEDKIDFYYAPVLELLERGRLAEAFRLMEQSRSHAMADLLASRTLTLGTARERELFAASVKLRAEIASAQQSLFNEAAAGGKEKQSAKIAALETQIGGREAAYQQLQAQMGREAPKLAALMVSEPATLESVERAAGAGGYDVLYYLVLEHAVILWHIDGQGAQVWNVFFPRSEVMKDVGSLRDNLTDRARNEQSTFDAQAARELFLFLIQPALASIHTHHLVILPHEDLNALPFQVLQNPVDGTYLGERYQISYAPSASVLATLPAQVNLAAGRLLAVADPGIGDAAREVEAIGKLYPGRSKVVDDVLVKKDDVKAWASDYNLLHLSVHGKFDPGNPLLSYLSFRSTPTDNGRLTAAEMFGLPLPRNAFVVLSACETGRVEATHANEVMGMVRGLLYAGASNVVLSLWEVQSEATALWMETFYREAQTHTPTESARLALIAVKSRKEYGHPFFWAPFVMTGK